MSVEPAPRFIDAGGNEYLGLAIDDALDLAGMLARLLDVIESPGVTEALEELLGSARNLCVGDDVSRWAPPGTSASATKCHAGSASWATSSEPDPPGRSPPDSRRATSPRRPVARCAKPRLSPHHPISGTARRRAGRRPGAGDMRSLAR